MVLIAHSLFLLIDFIDYIKLPIRFVLPISIVLNKFPKNKKIRSLKSRISSLFCPTNAIVSLNISICHAKNIDVYDKCRFVFNDADCSWKNFFIEKAYKLFLR